MRIKEGLQIGTAAYAVLTTGILLYIAGGLQVEQVQYVNREVIISGTGGTAASTTQFDYAKFLPYKSLTQTGGQIGYTIYSYDNPETYTGAIMEFCIDIATAATQVTAMYMDCGVVDESSDTSSGVSLFDNESLTTGTHCIVPGTTEVTLGPTQQIRCAGLTGTGTSLSGRAYGRLRETVAQ